MKRPDIHRIQKDKSKSTSGPEGNLTCMDNRLTDWASAAALYFSRSGWCSRSALDGGALQLRRMEGLFLLLRGFLRRFLRGRLLLRRFLLRCHS